MLSGYLGSLTDEISRKRYIQKIECVNSIDPYEILLDEWEDNVKLWLPVTHVHTYMYHSHLLLTPSSYMQEDLLNYKSLDSYRNFVQGWVRGVLVKAVQETEA